MQNALSKYRRKDVARDDILDALVASITAKLSFQKGLKSIPEIPEKDSQGLPMQVVLYNGLLIGFTVLETETTMIKHINYKDQAGLQIREKQIKS